MQLATMSIDPNLIDPTADVVRISFNEIRSGSVGAFYLLPVT